MAKKSHKKKRVKPAPRPPKSSRKHKKPLWLWAIPLAIVLAFAAVFWLWPAPHFDGEAAFSELEKQCAFGPRVPGSEAHQECGNYLASTLKELADQFYEQRFDYTDRNDSSRVYQGRNLVATFNTQPQRRQRLLLCAHWDSRPFADHDPDPSLRSQPVPGANDGASGVAVLLEIARILKRFPPEIGVDIVLFDLEDLGDSSQQDSVETGNPFCIGSRYFVNNIGNYRPTYGILLDMVGDANQRFPREGYSMQRAAAIVEKVWNAAGRIGAESFVDEMQGGIMDDHVPFLQKGIPVIDIIDFDYPYWHTTADTPDKCSASSLQTVGDVLLELIYRS